MELYILILKALLKGSNYSQYRKGTDDSLLERNFPEVERLYKTLDTLQQRQLKDYSVQDLELAFYTLYPRLKPESYEVLFRRVKEASADEGVLNGYMAQATERAEAWAFVKEATQVADGRISSSDNLKKIAAEYIGKKTVTVETDADPYKAERPNQNIKEFYESRMSVPGIRWRMKSFNQSIGSVRKGNFGFIFARPEVGKSAFILSEGTFMASQGDAPAVWFDNEEAMEDIHERILMASLGKTKIQIVGDMATAQREYDSVIGNRFHLHSSKGAMTRKYVEDRCRFYNPKVIFINQLDKITGFAADRYDLEMKAIYQWARELAKEYGPVVGVCQAGSTAAELITYMSARLLEVAELNTVLDQFGDKHPLPANSSKTILS